MPSPAPTLARLKKQLLAAWPKMGSANIGIMADARHIAGGTSDHIGGNAIDIPVAGGPADMEALLARLLANPAAHYGILNRRIHHPGKPTAAYHGSDPHTSHIHLSIIPSARDSAAPWAVTAPVASPKPPAPKPPAPKPSGPPQPLLRYGSVGGAVRTLQRALNAHGAVPALPITGNFLELTRKEVEDFQRARNLDVDGVVGLDTWAALGYR